MNALRNSAAFFLSHPIARRQYLRTILRILRWQILSRLHSVITVRWIGGTKLTVSRGARGATGNLYYGLHEFSPMAFTIHMLRPGDVFVDGGANIGTYTLLASAIAGAHTDAFEPDPGTIDTPCRQYRDKRDLGSGDGSCLGIGRSHKAGIVHLGSGHDEFRQRPG